jgi:hypothetical protein
MVLSELIDVFIFNQVIIDLVPIIVAVVVIVAVIIANDKAPVIRDKPQFKFVVRLSSSPGRLLRDFFFYLFTQLINSINVLIKL